MRTSLSQQIQNSLIHISNASNALMIAQNKAVSGKRISKPSDDVLGTSQAMSLRSTIKTNDQFADNMTVSKPMLSATEQSLQNLVKIVQSVKTIALAANTPDTTGSTNPTRAAQLDDIMGQLVDVANTQHLDQYIFSGTMGNVAPVKAQAGPQPYQYMGDSGTRSAQVLSWVSLPLNIPGDKVFNFDGSAGAGTTDLFTMVKNLRDAIAAGDSNAITAQYKNIDSNLDNLLSCTARVGNWLSRMDNAQGVLDDAKPRLQQMLSDQEDIDLPQAIIDLKTQENVYQSALMVSSQILNISLASMNNK